MIIMSSDFEKQEYWHQRFTTETAFEWLVPSETFLSTIEPYLRGLKPSSRILHIGFGTSDLQNNLRASGFLNVLNIDYEPLAIDRGTELERRAFGDVRMKYVVGDVTQLDLDGTFDLVVEKSTADAVACGGDEAILRMAKCVRGCLAHGGFWISLSYSSCRFDIRGLPLRVEEIARIPTPKSRGSDPDIYHYGYLLQPRNE